MNGHAQGMQGSWGPVWHCLEVCDLEARRQGGESRLGDAMKKGQQEHLSKDSGESVGGCAEASPEVPRSPSLVDMREARRQQESSAAPDP